MASLNQIRANQQNAQLSTGPRSVEGKAVVRRNALKSGIHAKAETALPFENPQDLEDLNNAHYELYNPATIVECGLVDDLVRDRWLLNRYAAIQGQLLTGDWVERYRQEHPELSLGHAWGNRDQALSRLLRCITTTRKSFAETFAALKRLQAETAAHAGSVQQIADQANPETAGPVPAEAPIPDQPGQVAPSGEPPLGIGFVPPVPQTLPGPTAGLHSAQPPQNSATPSSNTTSPKIGTNHSGQDLSHVPASSDEQPLAVGFVPPPPHRRPEHG